MDHIHKKAGRAGVAEYMMDTIRKEHDKAESSWNHDMLLQPGM
jgi:hypothetical protein